jgi:hypothetical protein
LSFVVVIREISALLLSLVDHAYYVNKSAKEVIKVLQDRLEPYNNVSECKTSWLRLSLGLDGVIQYGHVM